VSSNKGAKAPPTNFSPGYIRGFEASELTNVFEGPVQDSTEYYQNHLVSCHDLSILTKGRTR
jgi:hypothetical protein